MDTPLDEDVIELGYPVNVDDWTFLNHLYERGYKWDSTWKYLRIPNTCLYLHESEYRKGEWGIYTHPCLVGVMLFKKGLAKEFPTLDLVALDKKGQELNEWFRSQPDW